jgi:hypothetical protein
MFLLAAYFNSSNISRVDKRQKPLLQIFKKSATFDDFHTNGIRGVWTLVSVIEFSFSKKAVIGKNRRSVETPTKSFEFCCAGCMILICDSRSRPPIASSADSPTEKSIK